MRSHASEAISPSACPATMVGSLGEQLPRHCGADLNGGQCAIRSEHRQRACKRGALWFCCQYGERACHERGRKKGITSSLKKISSPHTRGASG